MKTKNPALRFDLKKDGFVPAGVFADVDCLLKALDSFQKQSNHELLQEDLYDVEAESLRKKAEKGMENLSAIHPESSVCGVRFADATRNEWRRGRGNAR